MRPGLAAAVAAIVAVAAAAGCTNTLYPGPKRPQSEIAVVAAQDVVLEALDGRKVYATGPKDKFELLPGAHVLSGRFQQVENHIIYNTVRTGGVVDICFVARRGRRYSLRGESDGERWDPELVDEAVRMSASVPCPRHLTLSIRGGGAAAGAGLALVEPDGLAVDAIDGHPIRDGLRYEVRPGKHAVTFHLHDVVPLVPGPARVDKQAVTVCVTLAAARYAAVPSYAGSGWKPALVEVSTGAPIAAEPMDGAVTDCGGTVAPAAAQAAAAAAGAVGTAAAAGAPAPEAAVARSARPDDEEPLRRRPPYQAAPPASFRPGMGTALGFRLGLGYGGDRIAEVQLDNGSSTLRAGGGFLGALALMVTPVWVSDSVGLGVSSEIGWYFDSVDASNGSLTFSRYPFAASLHLLGRVSDQWAILVTGGVRKDLDVHLSGEGFAGGANANLTSRLGGTGGVGFYYASSAHVACDVLLRFTMVHYEAGGQSISGSEGQLSTALYYNF